MGRAPAPILVTVTAAPEGRGPIQLLSRELGHADAGSFIPFRFSLGELEGKDVRFELSVSAPEGARATRPQSRSMVALVRPRVEIEARGGPPNVMLVILDTVRLDALGSSGQRRVLTPALDGLAARGVRFTGAFTNAPWTRPSLMSLLSARPPGASGATPTSFFPHEPDVALVRSGAVSTLPDHLERQGYLVRGLAQNYFMLPEERVGADFGFSSFAHMFLSGGPHRADNPTLTAGAEQFLAANRDRRFFLFLHYESAHAPYSPPKEDLDAIRAHLGPGAQLGFLDKYRGEVGALDRLVARLVAALEKEGLSDQTLLVITSDHGETLDKAHCFFLPKLKYNTCYGHSPSLYDEVLRVPLILVGPGLPKGRVVTQPTRLIDLGPTLLDLLGLPALPGAEGSSVAPWIRGPRPDEPRDVYAVGRGVFALRRGAWKYIWRAPLTRTRVVEGKEIRVMEELYDLESDPQEHRNIAARRPEVARELREALFALMRKDRFPVGPSAPHLGRHVGPKPVLLPQGVR
jgi:arylsulfatase A-like enzyme